MTEQTPRASGSIAALMLIVGVAGAGTMAVELAAVRLLAPWYGASSGVWTNVIGVILLALAIGYLVGARLSARAARPARTLGIVLLFAAAFTVWLPFLSRPVAELFLPTGLALDEAAGLLVWGSLAASMLLFLPAAAMLGCIGPLAVEVVQQIRHCHAGEAGGRVLCASTVGSLVGTFATTHVLLPTLGLDLTFLGSSAALGLAGLWMMLRARSLTALAGAALAVALVGGAVSRTHPPVPTGRLLAERQSPYQSVRVVETGDGASRFRMLQVNESLDSFQSVWQPRPGFLPRGYYYNLFALPALWAAEPGPWNVLILGLGAGTTVRVLEGVLPAEVELSTVGVEIDPVVVELGERYFDLASGVPDRIVLAGADARGVLRNVEACDQVVLDAYANNMEIPAHLSSVEFFREVRERLVPGGWLSINAAGFGLDDPVVRAVTRTVAAAFEAEVLVVRVPFARNCVIFARREAQLPAPGSDAWNLAGEAQELVASLALPSAWEWVEPSGENEPVLTDDLNPIDELQRRSVAAGRAKWLEAP